MLGKATGHAVKNACSQRVKKPGAKPVSLTVTMAVISVAIISDMQKAKTILLYF